MAIDISQSSRNGIHVVGVSLAQSTSRRSRVGRKPRALTIVCHCCVRSGTSTGGQGRSGAVNQWVARVFGRVAARGAISGRRECEV